MTTADPFITAAREEAETRWPEWPLGHAPERLAFVAAAEWAWSYLAAQEPTNAEVLAALNADCALRFGPSNRPADSLEPYGDEHVQIMRAALSAARRARGGTK